LGITFRYLLSSGGDSSTTFNGARLRRGIANPQAPVGCSGDVKQQRAQTTAITDQNAQCSVLSHCWMLLASGECVSRPKCHERHVVLSYINSAKGSAA
jgi:hypothetical protein